MFILQLTSALVLVSSVLSASFNCDPCECSSKDCDIIEADCSLRSDREELYEIPGYFAEFVQKLNLAGQPLKVLEENVFENANLTGLIELQLQKCQIGEIHNQTFRNMSKLTDLDLRDNFISRIDNAMFAGLTSLKTLLLSNNSIKILPNFQNIPELDTLYLDSNLLSYLDENVFSNNTKLISLDLSDNKIKVFPDKLLKNLVNLEYLHFSGNTLARIPDNAFQNNSKLHIIFLKNNTMVEFPKKLFENFTRISVLDLSHNTLKHIPENMFHKDSSINHIYLNNNELEEIPSNTFKNLSRILLLHLSHNNINSLKTGFIEYANCLGFAFLLHIDISNNNVSHLPSGVFRKACSTLIIDLSFNQISSLDPQAFSDVEILHLDLSHNKIYSLDINTIKPMYKLDLSFNNLTILTPGLFSAVKSSLNLSNNFIKTITSETFGSNKYRALSLANNNITYFNLNINNFLLLDLSNNPINCDCKLRQEHVLFKGHLSHIQCFTPVSLRGKSWDTLQSTQFACAPEIQDNFTETTNGITRQIGCKVYGSPAPDIQWIKNNKTLDKNDSSVITTRTNLTADTYWYNLTFSKNADYFAGQYVCELNNSAGIVKMNFMVLETHSTSHVAAAIWTTVLVLIVVVVIVAIVQFYRRRFNRSNRNTNTDSDISYEHVDNETDRIL